MRTTLATLALLARLSGALLHAGTLAESAIRWDDVSYDLVEQAQEQGDRHEVTQCKSLVWIGLNAPTAQQG